MSDIAALIRNMAAAGAPAEAIALAVEAIEAAGQKDTERRARAAEKKARQRAAGRGHVGDSPGTVPGHGRDNPTPFPDKERTKEINPTPTRVGNKPTREKDLAEFRAELAELPADVLDGMLKLRRAKNAPATGLAARKFRQWATECGLSALEAAEMCIGSNWLVVKPEYLRNRQAPPQRGSPPAGPSRPTNAAQLSRQELLNPERNDHGSDRTARLLDAGDRTQRGAGSGPSGGYAFTAYGRA